MSRKCVGDDVLEAIRSQDQDKCLSLMDDKENMETLRNWRDDRGCSLLHWVAMCDIKEAVFVCLDKLKIPPDVKAENLQTPLMWAAIHENIIIMDILKCYGADCDARDDLGDNILTLGAQHEKFLTCIWAISNGADRDAKNIAGSTAAHWAAFSGAYMLLSVLESFGADLETTYDSAGLLPLHRSLQLEFYATARMLVDLRPSLLHSKTKDGLDLSEFAYKNELSQLWFSEFMALCKDPKHVTKIFTSQKARKEPEISWSETIRTVLKLRSILWEKFADQLLALETSRHGRIFIPIIAFSFAGVFVAAWQVRVSLRD